MNLTTVVNIRQEGYDVYIGRGGRDQDGYFGNPIKLQPGEQRGSTLTAYRSYFIQRLNTDPEFKERVHSLSGKRLGCFCKPGPCHGDIIADYLTSLTEHK